MASFVDGRCYREEASEVGPPLFSGGSINFQAHHVGWLISGFCSLVACIVSFWLINKHLQWYTVKREQRYIVRILFMPPIYAIVSLVSYIYWNQSTPIILARDAYESIVLTSFFYLLLMFISHDPAEQRRVFLEKGLSKEADEIALKKGRKVRKWVLPLGFIKAKPRDGMYFLQMMKWGVLQYAVLRPTTTLAAVVLDYIGLYCEGSWGLGWGHVYITIIVSLSVTVAMYCLIQLYMVVSEELSPYKPLLKLFSIKAVVFLTFWQATFLSVLAMFNVVKDTKYMTAEDVNIGIGAIAETFEMTLFAFLHVKAFSYLPYKPGPGAMVDPGTVPKRTPRWRSLGHAMDFRETFRELWLGTKYMWSRYRNKTPKVDREAMKASHYTRAFAEVRPSHMGRTSLQASGKDSSKVDRGSEKQLPTLPTLDFHVDRTVEDDITGERQWLGAGDDYGYGLGYLHREKSESLEAQIQRELALRGYSDEIPGRGHIGRPDEDLVGHTRGKRSWWRSLYDRVSNTGLDEEDEQRLTTSSMKEHGQRASRGNTNGNTGGHKKVSPRAGQRLLSEYDQNYLDPPPQGLLRPFTQRFSSGRVISDSRAIPPRNGGEMDMLAPLSVFNDRRKVSPQPHSQPVPLPVVPPAKSGPYLTSSNRIHRSDSLLGRVFPHNTDTESSTEQGHASDSAHSLPSVSTHGVRPSQATPKASLVPGVPRYIPQDRSLGMAGERSTFSSMVHSPRDHGLTAKITQPAPMESDPFNDTPETFTTPPTSPNLPSSSSPHLVSPASTSSPTFVSSPPPMTVPSPPPVIGEKMVVSPIAEHSTQRPDASARQSRRHSREGKGLTRTPARVYARDSLSPPRQGQSRRQSMPVTPAPYDPRLPVPVPEYNRHQRMPRPATSGHPSSSRRYSAPGPPTLYAGDVTRPRPGRPLTVHEERSSQDMGSEITQPSYSGTLASHKFRPSTLTTPAPLSAVPAADLSSRYPSLVSEPRMHNPMPDYAPRSPRPMSYSNVHMSPSGPSSPPSASRAPANSRRLSTNPNDFSSPVSNYRPHL